MSFRASDVYISFLRCGTNHNSWSIKIETAIEVILKRTDQTGHQGHPTPTHSDRPDDKFSRRNVMPHLSNLLISTSRLSNDSDKMQ